MCDPLSATIAMAVGQAAMQYQSAQNQAKAYKVEARNQAAVNNFNAAQDREAATQATRQGAQDAGIVRENMRRENATARAKLASTGLDADVGTPATLIDQNVQMGETNAMTVMRDAQLKAMGFENAARSQEFEGANAINTAAYKAKMARANGLLDAAGTLVSGASSAGMFSNSSPLFSQRASGMGASPGRAYTRLGNGQTVTWR